jgi:hypothetical protein
VNLSASQRLCGRKDLNHRHSRAETNPKQPSPLLGVLAREKIIPAQQPPTEKTLLLAKIGPIKLLHGQQEFEGISHGWQLAWGARNVCIQ